jgi:hypothetical protein
MGIKIMAAVTALVLGASRILVGSGVGHLPQLRRPPTLLPIRPATRGEPLRQASA